MKHLAAFGVTVCCFILIGVAISAPAAAAVTSNATLAATQSASPINDKYQSLITKGLASVSQVTAIEVTENGSVAGNRVVTITYASIATTAQERVDEWMAILQPLTGVITGSKLNLDQITLVALDSDGDPIGQMTTSKQDLLAYADKRMTRARFLFRAKYVSLRLVATPQPETATQAATASTTEPDATGTPNP